MISCKKCNKYSYGNEYCYTCYHKELKSLIVTNTNEKYECAICNTTINHPGYCERCYERNTPLEFEELIKKYNLKRIKPKCRKCNNEVKDFGFEYCEKHYEEYIQSLKHSIIQKNENNHSYGEEHISNNPKYNKPYIKNDGYNISDFDLISIRNRKQQFEINKIINKKNEEITYISKNGTKVKSKSEQMICDFLTDHNIIFFYEKPLYYSDYKKPLKPDFYIKGPIIIGGRILYDFYIEHLGGLTWKDPIKRNNYINTLAYKMDIYEREGITLLCTYEDDMQNINKSLLEKLKKIKKGRINK